MAAFTLYSEKKNTILKDGYKDKQKILEPITQKSKNREIVLLENRYNSRKDRTIKGLVV